eukprot:2218153-Rhodomonas_salina.3
MPISSVGHSELGTVSSLASLRPPPRMCTRRVSYAASVDADFWWPILTSCTFLSATAGELTGCALGFES